MEYIAERINKETIDLFVELAGATKGAKVTLKEAETFCAAKLPGAKVAERHGKGDSRFVIHLKTQEEALTALSLEGEVLTCGLIAACFRHQAGSIGDSIESWRRR